MIANDKFREDLFYRLNIISITIPPLRDRKEDIPLLIDHFNQKLSKENNKKPLSISPKIKNVLGEYYWPGNVRELENFIHRMVILCSKSITMEQIPAYMKIDFDKNNTTQKLVSLAEKERQYVLKVLEATGNNKTKAAEILGIDRKTLRSKLK